jgi:hypothetical protein
MSSYRIACLVALVVCGCQQDPKRDQPPAGSASAATAAAASAAPATSGSAGAAASAAVGSPDIAALVGTWEGSYDAKKGTVAMPTGEKDKHWSKDEGKTHVGAGTITLRVSPAGDIEGEAKGVLGEQVLSGKAEGNVLRATVSPKEATDPQGFTGVLVCLHKDGAAKGELKAAGPTADVVRESAVELKKKK